MRKFYLRRACQALLGAVLIISLLPRYVHAAGSVKRYPSPAKKYEVSFVELEHKKFTKEDLKQGFDNVSNVHYRIDFFKKGASAPITSVTWHDVYGAYMNEPTPVKSLVGDIRWSPSEDFVILPSEGWVSGPGTPPSRALALNEELGWKEVSFTIDQFVKDGRFLWHDDTSFFGDAHEDCSYSVLMFDGKAGSTIEVKPSVSPVGFELVSVLPGRLHVRQVLDNCAPIGATQRIQRCFSIDLETKKETGIRCP